jgi:hypothetical protein
MVELLVRDRVERTKALIGQAVRVRAHTMTHVECQLLSERLHAALLEQIAGAL